MLGKKTYIKIKIRWLCVFTKLEEYRAVKPEYVCFPLTSYITIFAGLHCACATKGFSFMSPQNCSKTVALKISQKKRFFLIIGDQIEIFKIELELLLRLIFF